MKIWRSWEKKKKLQLPSNRPEVRLKGNDRLEADLLGGRVAASFNTGQCPTLVDHIPGSAGISLISKN